MNKKELKEELVTFEKLMEERFDEIEKSLMAFGEKEKEILREFERKENERWRSVGKILREIIATLEKLEKDNLRIKNALRIE